MEAELKLERILFELRKISHELKRLDKGDDYSIVNFYRDSLEFMTDENLKSFDLIRELQSRLAEVEVHH